MASKLKLYVLVGIILLFSATFLLFVGVALAWVESGSKKLVSVELSEKPYNNIAFLSAKEKKLQLIITDSGKKAPDLSSEAALIKDLNSGKVIYQKNPGKKLSPASITKLMTAIIGVNHFKMDDLLTVPGQALVGGSTMNLISGEKLTFRSLLYGMMLNSGNDAAYTIALNYPGGVNMFVSQMNKKVKELGLVDTNFDNPAGFDSPNNYSSAYDLSQIASLAAQTQELQRVVATKETSVMAYDSGKVHYLKNLNKLLGEDGILGLKTGYSEKSGENLVTLVEKNSNKILTVVLNSKDRFGETRKLIDWTYDNFVWRYQ